MSRVQLPYSVSRATATRRREGAPRVFQGGGDPHIGYGVPPHHDGGNEMTMPPKIARLAGLGAFGACAGLLALYLLLVYVTRPSARGGIDAVNATVAWIALGGLVAALIVAHVMIGNQLLRLAQRGHLRHPL